MPRFNNAKFMFRYLFATLFDILRKNAIKNATILMMSILNVLELLKPQLNDSHSAATVSAGRLFHMGANRWRSSAYGVGVRIVRGRL